MGQYATRFDCVSMYVQTDSQFYNPGAQITGAVYLESTAMFSASHIDLRIKGTEKAKWEELKNAAPQQPGAPQQNLSERITEKIQDKRYIINQVVPLFQVGGILQPGQYKIPFIFQLKSGIPGSFSFKHLDSLARVKYRLSAVLVTGTGKDVKHTTEFVVREIPIIPRYNEPIKSDQAVCVCCISKGRCTLECNFQSNTYVPGDTAYAVCKADNRNCTVAIKHFSISLIRTVILRARGKENRLVDTITNKDFDGIQAGAENFGAPKLMDLLLVDAEHSIVTQGKDKQNLGLQPTVNGGLVNCSYTLNIYPIFDAPCSCCSNVPVCTLPLVIFSPAPSQFITAIPQGFAPQVLNSVNFILTDPVPMPAISMQVNLPGMAISAQPPAFGMNVQVNAPAPELVVHAAVPNVQMNVSGGDIRLDAPGVYVEPHVSANVQMGVPGAAVRVDAPGVYVEPQMGVYGAGAGVQVNAPNVYVEPHVGITGAAVRVDAPGVYVEPRIGGNVQMGVSGAAVQVSAPGVYVEPHVGVNAEVVFPPAGVHVEAPGVYVEPHVGVGAEVNLGAHAEVSVNQPGLNVTTSTNAANVEVNLNPGGMNPHFDMKF